MLGAAAIVSAALLVSPAASSAAPCPGAPVSCPYLSLQSFGDAPGLLRSPDAVAVDPATGNIFVADVYSFRIEKFDPSGNLLMQIGGYGYGNGLFNGGITALAVAGGNLYAATYAQIQEFTLAGTFVRSAGAYGGTQDNTNAGKFAGISGLATDGTTLYVVDSGDNRVQTYDLGLTTAHVVVTGSSGGSGSGQLSSPGGDAVIGTHLYVADRYNQRVEDFGSISGTSVTPVGSFGTGYGAGPDKFEYPTGIAADPGGHLFIADSNNQRVTEWSLSGSWAPTPRTWGGLGVGNGRFIYPNAIATDAGGNVYVTDGANRVQKFAGSGSFLAKFGGDGEAPGRFERPVGVAVAPNGVFYEAGYNSNVVQRLTAAGVAVGGTVIGPGTAFNFGSPTGMAVDGAGNLSVIDTYNARIDRFDASGNFLNEFGGPSGSLSGQLSYPAGIAVDGAGNSYVADSSNNRIEVFDASGNFVRTWGQNSGSGEGNLSSPYGIAVDNLGNVFVADASFQRVDEFTTTGTFERMWGWGVRDGAPMLEVCTTACHAGNAGTGAGQFKYPIGIAIAGGNVWVLDQDNYNVQGFSTSGSLVSAFGSQGLGAGQFASPQGIASDSAGNLYVADNGLNTIQKFVFTNPAPPPTPTPTPQPTPAPKPPHGLLGRLHALLLKSLLSGGLYVPCTSDEPATCYAALVLSASDAKSLKLASTAAKRHPKKYKAVVIGSATARLTKPGTVNLHIKLTSAGKRALRHLRKSKLTLTLAGALTNSAGQLTPLHGSVTIKRR